MDRPAGRGGWQLFGWTLAISLAICHALMLNRYAINFPAADDFTQLLAVPGYVEYTPTLPGKIAYLLSLSVDHRIVTLRALAFAQAMSPWGLNFRALIFVGNTLVFAAGILVLWQAPTTLRGWLAPLFALLIFSPTNWLAQYWPTGAVQHFALIAYALFALFCVEKIGRGWTAAAVSLALCAAFTAANGLMVFPAVVVQLWISGRRRAALIWLVGALALGMVYFIGYVTPEGRPSILDALHRPFEFFAWYTFALGSMGVSVGSGTALPATIGGGLIAIWIWLLVLSPRYPVRPLFLGWMLFLFASTAAIAVGRAPLGIEALGNSRYRVYSEFAVLITLLAVIWRMRASRMSGLQGWLVGLLLPVATAWAWISWDANMGTLVEYSQARRNALDHYNVTRGQGIYGEFPPQDFGDFILARTRNSRQFLPEGDASPAGVLSAGTPPAANSPPFLSAPPPVLLGGAMSVHGQTWDSQPVSTLWLRSAEGAYRGTLHRECVYAPILGRRRFGFWGTWSTAGLVPARYQIGYGTDDSPDGSILWTSDWIDIR